MAPFLHVAIESRFPTPCGRSWTPPSWFFGPAWTIMYSLMGVSSWIVWKNGAGWVPLTL